MGRDHDVEDLRIWVWRMRLFGWGPRRIADRAGVRSSLVVDLLHSKPPVPVRAAVRARDARWLAEFRAGEPLWSIADRHGYALGTVAAAIHRAEGRAKNDRELQRHAAKLAAATA